MKDILETLTKSQLEEKIGSLRRTCDEKLYLHFQTCRNAARHTYPHIDAQRAGYQVAYDHLGKYLSWSRELRRVQQELINREQSSKYAITPRDRSIEDPDFRYSEQEVCRKWFRNVHGTTGSLDMIVMGSDGKEYFPGYDGSYFLNTEA